MCGYSWLSVLIYEQKPGKRVGTTLTRADLIDRISRGMASCFLVPKHSIHNASSGTSLSWEDERLLPVLWKPDSVLGASRGWGADF